MKQWPPDVGGEETAGPVPTYTCVITGEKKERRVTIFGQVWNFLCNTFYTVLYMDVAKALKVSPECITWRIRHQFLPPLDVRQRRSKGWARDTIKHSDPGLYRVLESFYTDLQAHG